MGEKDDRAILNDDFPNRCMYQVFDLAFAEEYNTVNA
jgi:hypothetical protein